MGSPFCNGVFRLSYINLNDFSGLVRTCQVSPDFQVQLDIGRFIPVYARFFLSVRNGTRCVRDNELPQLRFAKLAGRLVASEPQVSVTLLRRQKYSLQSSKLVRRILT